jgi:hypothetical protein
VWCDLIEISRSEPGSGFRESGESGGYDSLALRRRVGGTQQGGFSQECARGVWVMVLAEDHGICFCSRTTCRAWAIKFCIVFSKSGLTSCGIESQFGRGQHLCCIRYTVQRTDAVYRGTYLSMKLHSSQLPFLLCNCLFHSRINEYTWFPWYLRQSLVVW